MFPVNAQDLPNTAGHGAGVLIFGIFAYLFFRQRFGIQFREHSLAFFAAALALTWNGASLAVLLHGAVGGRFEQWAATIGFMALSILPAVLFHLCLRYQLLRFIHIGYGLSALAVITHVVELFRDTETYHRAGLGLITVGFGALTTVAGVYLLWSGRRDAPSLISRAGVTMLLFLFAISFVHFGQGHSYEVWSTELIVHHAGIPLALFFILRDFRFVLLDALVRFLANGLLAGMFGIVGAWWMPEMGFSARALLIALTVGSFALLRDRVQHLLGRLAFRQPTTQETEHVMRELAASTSLESEYVAEALQRIAALMRATCMEVSGHTTELRELVFPIRTTDTPRLANLLHRGVRVIVPVRIASGEFRYGLLTGRQGGQPYLSEDLDLIARLATVISEKIDQLRSSEMHRLVSEAELRALQAQINPHFLFNALNTLYGVVPREAALARKLVLDLADMFRYFLRTERAFVPLADEIRIVRAYLAIEQARLGTNLQVSIDVEDSVLHEMIPVLSIQPLVENAVKHGAAARPRGCSVRVEVRREEKRMLIRVHDTGPGFRSQSSQNSAGDGVGLANVSRRLSLCYGDANPLHIESDATGTCVSFVATAGLKTGDLQAGRVVAQADH